MRNYKVTLFLEKNKVTLDINIKATLFPKGHNVSGLGVHSRKVGNSLIGHKFEVSIILTLGMHIKVTLLIKENKVTLVILDIEGISIL